MKQIGKLLFISYIFLAMSQSAYAQEQTPPIEPESGGIVCEPDVYLSEPDNCQPFGPSAYLTELARLGITIPPRPLPASKPDPSLTQLPYFYFHLDEDYVPIYGAPGEKGPGGQQFPPGFVYVSYIDRVEQNGVYYLMPNGGWIPGKGARVGEISSFQGLVFTSTPKNSFGWAFELLPIMKSPGYNAAQTGRQVMPFEVVTIYNTQIMDNEEWYMIGPDQWLEGRKVARVIVNTNIPQGVTTNRWIDVDLAEQTLAVYENNQLIFATVIASGLEPFWTRPGIFQIFEKKETETMRNNDMTDFYYLDNVPWTMYFDGARALHGAYWRTRFGYPQSHGCINLSVGDSHWLFNWATVGDWVYVHDRTGLTPTDPALYTGGAY
ncbi:L,D-transpeptidase [Candidatus Villigracilis affinis]|uniref:L,D-transpeptidase n=1 Tax=Candidatus Villigracilis affinis TaxID=3140682 RepID=UPI002A20F52D|nr:L,D-transpeptidase [Anaerolineales bacterium]